MKINTPLTRENKVEMERLLDLARERLKIDSSEEQKKKKVEAHCASLEAEARTLNAAFKNGDLEALEALTSKKHQLALIADQRRGEDRPAEKRTQTMQWIGLMTQMASFIRPYLGTSRHERRQEIAQMLRPFFQSDHVAYDRAGQTDEILGFSRFLDYRLQNISSPKACVGKDLIPIFENILAGKEFWTFDPYPNK